MRVICIKDQPPYTKSHEHVPEIKVGEDKEVANIVHHEGRDWYIFVGMSPYYGYAPHCFTPLSTIDETEFTRNYNKETV